MTSFETNAYVFPSIEEMLVDFLPNVIGGTHVLTELPHNFQDVTAPTGLLPVVAIERISGAELIGSPSLDRPIVDVDCFGSDRSEAQAIAERVRYAIKWILPGLNVNGVVFTRTRTVVGPRLLPHANPAVRRYSATYELVLHPQP